MSDSRKIIAIAQDADGSSYGTLASNLSHLLCAEYILFREIAGGELTDEVIVNFSGRMHQIYQAFLALNAEKKSEAVRRSIGEIIGFGRHAYDNNVRSRDECYQYAFRSLLSEIRLICPLWLNELFAVANQVVQDYTATLVQPGDLVLVGSFSNRLYQQLDLLAMKLNFTHSFFHDLPYFSLSMREHFQQQNVHVVFNPVLLTDIQAELHPGEYLMSLLTGANMQSGVTCYYDHSKIAALLLAAQNLANRFPNQKIRLVVLENKDGILNKLMEIFNLAQMLLPDTIELDICRLSNGLEHLKLITGSGKVSPNYAREIRHLLSLAKYQALLNDPKSTSIDVYQNIDFREYYAYLQFSAGSSVNRVKIGSRELYDEVFYIVLKFIIHRHGLRLKILSNRMKAQQSVTQDELANFNTELRNTLDEFTVDTAIDTSIVEQDPILRKIYENFHHYFNRVAPDFIAEILYFVHKASFMDHTLMADEDENCGVLLEPKFNLKASEEGYIRKDSLIQDLHYLTFLLNDASPPCYFFLDRRLTECKLYYSPYEARNETRAHEPVTAKPNPRKTHLTYNSLINLFQPRKLRQKKLPAFRKHISSSK